MTQDRHFKQVVKKAARMAEVSHAEARRLLEQRAVHFSPAAAEAIAQAFQAGELTPMLIMGPTGCGKTTLLQSLFQLPRLTAAHEKLRKLFFANEAEGLRVPEHSALHLWRWDYAQWDHMDFNAIARDSSAEFVIIDDLRVPNGGQVLQKLAQEGYKTLACVHGYEHIRATQQFLSPLDSFFVIQLRRIRLTSDYKYSIVLGGYARFERGSLISPEEDTLGSRFARVEHVQRLEKLS